MWTLREIGASFLWAAKRFTSFLEQFFHILRGPTNHCLITFNHNWALQQDWIFYDGREQFLFIGIRRDSELGIHLFLGRMTS